MSDGGGGSPKRKGKTRYNNGAGGTGSGGSSPHLQYSESMPVWDATAPYAVQSNANVVISSASSPGSQTQKSFDSDHLGVRYGPPRPSSPARPVTPLSQQATITPIPASAANTLVEPPRSSTPKKQSFEFKRKSFFSTPKRNSTSSLKFQAPSTANPKVSSEGPERPDYHIKVVCVGDGGCGKTCLMLTYTYGTFPTTYIPTVFENYLTNVRSANGKLIELALWDTAGQEEYDRLRVLSYPEVNLLLVCFAIDSPTSLDNVLDKWVPEISHFCPEIPFILVGLKSDLRDNPPELGSTQGDRLNPKHISPEQAKAMASRIGANRYMECSARLSRGISNVFETAISLVLADHLGLPEPPIEEVFIPPVHGTSTTLKQSIKISFKMPKSSVSTKQLKPAKVSKPEKNIKKQQPEYISSKPSTKNTQNIKTTNKKKSKCIIL